MNDKETMKLAREAGLKGYQEQAPGIDGVYGNWADLEAFAALIDAKATARERKALEKINWNALLRECGLVAWKDVPELIKCVVTAIKLRGQA